MRYAHIMMALTEERWALEQSKLQAILDFMADQNAGLKYSAEEIEAKIGKGREQDVARQQGSVAILPIRGVISNRMSMFDDISGGMSSEGFARKFQAAMADECVKAIIFDVDSPGGMVSGTDELSSMIYDARGGKPIVAHVNARAASAAYWIASSADEVVVTPSGEVGSIGVLAIHDDMSNAMEKLGVKKTIISAGKFKVDGNPYQALGDDTRDRIQAKVDSSYDSFTRAVARNRGKSLTAVREGFGQGDMVMADAAITEGMADRVGTLEDTLRRFGATQYPPAPAKRRSFAAEREKRALQF